MGKAVSVFMDICRLNSHTSPFQSLHFPPVRKRPFHLCTVNTSFQEISQSNMFLFLCPYFKEVLSLQTILVLVYWVLASLVTALLYDNHREETLAQAGVIRRCSGRVPRALAPAGAVVVCPRAVPLGLCPWGCLCPAVLLDHVLHGLHTAPSVLCSFLQNFSIQANKNIFRFTALDLSLLPQPLFLNLVCGANVSRQGRTCRSVCVCQYLAQQCPEPSEELSLKNHHL